MAMGEHCCYAKEREELRAERDGLRAELELARGVAREMWNRAHEWAETGDGCTWQYLENYAKAYDWLP
jgi:hypothetical protein